MASITPEMEERIKCLVLNIFQKLSHRRMVNERMLKSAELSIVLTNNKDIQSINKKFRNKDAPTDVLSFPILHPEELKALSKKDTGPWQIGDVVINMELAKSRGEKYSWGYAREVDRLLVHGILHLLGYDHEKSKKEEQKMQKLEKLSIKRVKKKYYFIFYLLSFSFLCLSILFVVYRSRQTFLFS